MTSITLGQGGASFIPHIRPIQRHLGFLLRQWLAKYLPLGIQPSDHSEHNVGGDTIVLREGEHKGLGPADQSGDEAGAWGQKSTGHIHLGSMQARLGQSTLKRKREY